MRKIFRIALALALALLAHTVSMIPSHADELPTYYIVTVLKEGNGEAYSYVVSGPAGTSVTLVATPEEGHRLKEWQVISGGVTIQESQDGPYHVFILQNEDAVVKAVFEPIPTSNDTRTIFSTDYESSFWNWFKFIVLFGWIWMWF